MPHTEVTAIGEGEKGGRVERVDVEAVIAEPQVVNDLGLQHMGDVGAGTDAVAGEGLLRYGAATDDGTALENEDT